VQRLEHHDERVLPAAHALLGEIAGHGGRHA
jgi:hypothetical protein